MPPRPKRCTDSRRRPNRRPMENVVFSHPSGPDAPNGQATVYHTREDAGANAPAASRFPGSLAWANRHRMRAETDSRLVFGRPCRRDGVGPGTIVYAFLRA